MLKLVAMVIAPCSAVNSCPVSPESSYRQRVPSFDLKAMAKYASKLLSSHELNESDNEVMQNGDVCSH